MGSLTIRKSEAAVTGELDDYWTGHFTTGIEQNGLSLSLFIDDIFDERGVTGRYTECAILTCGGVQYDVVVRPMTGGVRVGQNSEANCEPFAASEAVALVGDAH